MFTIGIIAFIFHMNDILNMHDPGLVSTLESCFLSEAQLQWKVQQQTYKMYRQQRSDAD